MKCAVAGAGAGAAMVTNYASLKYFSGAISQYFILCIYELSDIRRKKNTYFISSPKIFVLEFGWWLKSQPKNLMEYFKMRFIGIFDGIELLNLRAITKPPK